MWRKKEVDYYTNKKRKTNFCLNCVAKKTQTGIRKPRGDTSYISSDGYKMIKCHGEYDNSGRTKYKRAHVLVMENYIGRKLKTQQGNNGEQIHHIDGNRENNKLENLICVSIEDHYKIHYEQGDFVACQLIAKRMILSPEEISKIRSEANRQKAKEGRHPAQLAVINGTHHFIGETNPTHQRIKNKTHNFQINNPGRKAWESGTHNWDIHPSKKKVISLETGYITSFTARTKHDRKTGMRHTWLPIESDCRPTLLRLCCLTLGS
jgi:hypothetical protein